MGLLRVPGARGLFVLGLLSLVSLAHAGKPSAESSTPAANLFPRTHLRASEFTWSVLLFHPVAPTGDVGAGARKLLAAKYPRLNAPEVPGKPPSRGRGAGGCRQGSGSHRRGSAALLRPDAERRGAQAPHALAAGHAALVPGALRAAQRGAAGRHALRPRARDRARRLPVGRGDARVLLGSELEGGAAGWAGARACRSSPRTSRSTSTGTGRARPCA